MKYKSMFPWMILDMALFVALNVILIRILHPNFELISYLSPFRLFVLGLAAYRAANIVSNEFITTPIRAYFVREAVVDGRHVEEPYEEGFRGFLGSLLYCPSCTGVWLSTLMIYAYVFWPGPMSIVIVVLAVSGLERLFALLVGRIKRK